MLESIHIENIALIKNLDIRLCDSFCAFTGETGAGKSIIIDSIGVLCGNKADKELIRSGEKSAVVEGIFSDIGVYALETCKEYGVFPDEDGVLHISRSIGTESKGSVRINGRTVPNSVLKQISPSLINIHGQHDNTELLNKESHKKLLDEYGELHNELNMYSETYAEYCELKKKLDAMVIDEGEKLRNIEMLRFQINDISCLKLREGEEEKLIEEKKRLLNLEKLSRNTAVVTSSLYGGGNDASECIDRAIDALKNLSKISDEYIDYTQELTDIKSRIIDISETVADMQGDECDNPEYMLDKIESRLDAISKAKRKYGSDIGEVLEFYRKAKERLDELENFDRASEKLRSELEKCKAVLKSKADTLTNSRKKVADELKKSIENQLVYLDMPGVKFKVGFEEKDFSKDGCDEIEFFVMTNSGEGFSPLSKTASGGELSRIMLAIKSVIAEKDGIDTLIFDEIDTGISGKTSRKIGLKLSEIAKVSQVLCVTHSAQICSVANTHYKVSKHENDGRTLTTVTALDDKERIDETARIIAGINITDSAVKAAKELIENKSL